MDLILIKYSAKIQTISFRMNINKKPRQHVTGPKGDEREKIY